MSALEEIENNNLFISFHAVKSAFLAANENTTIDLSKVCRTNCQVFLLLRHTIPQTSLTIDIIEAGTGIKVLETKRTDVQYMYIGFNDDDGYTHFFAENLVSEFKKIGINCELKLVQKNN